MSTTTSYVALPTSCSPQSLRPSTLTAIHLSPYEVRIFPIGNHFTNMANFSNMAPEGIWVAGSALPFLISLSERIATLVPQLTLDFISEVSTTLDKASRSQRLHCLSYMSPWLKNLAKFIDPTSPTYDHSGAKTRDCIRLLIDLTIADPQVRISLRFADLVLKSHRR